MSIDIPLILHLLVFVLLMAALLSREIGRVLSRRPAEGTLWLLDAAVPGLLVAFLLLAGTRLAELL